MTNDLIQKFILKDEDNFRIASTVGDVWPEVMEQIVDKLYDSLEARLKPKLKDWRFAREERFGIDAFPSFYFWRPEWKDEYGVCLQTGEYGKKVVMGVYRETKILKKRRFCSELLEAVKVRFPTAHERRPWWEAEILVHSPASDWRMPDALWQIKTDDRIHLELAEQLLDLARISEPYLRKMVRNKK